MRQWTTKKHWDIKNLHPCDHCTRLTPLKYKYCKKCNYRWGKKTILRTAQEVKEIKNRLKLMKNRNRQKAFAKKLTQLPAKNRKKSIIIDALLEGKNAAQIIENRQIVSTGKVRSRG